MTRRRMSVALVVLVLLGTPWADAAAQRTAAEVAATRQRAEQGDAFAQYNLGIMHRTGQGVPQDAVEALKWLNLAADQGAASAQSSLGDMYSLGEGVPEDDVEGARWYRLAADQGWAGAQSNLGAMYRNGEGVPQDYVEALRLYRLAADQGNVFGQHNLGYMYTNGVGVPQDYVEAHKWANLAAARATGDDREQIAEFLDSLAKLMTPAQLAEAQRLAKDWQAVFDAPS